jgi:hypothetical protein
MADDLFADDPIPAPPAAPATDPRLLLALWVARERGEVR